MTTQTELETTIEALAQPGKGILAADESNPTMAKRLKAIDVESTEANRLAYRSLILSTPGLGEFINGVILFEETLRQSTADGQPIAALAQAQGIVPGIKVDKGLAPLAGSAGDDITRGLDGLGDRLQEYKALGARFAKWRCVYHITEDNPRQLAVQANAEVLARYAAVCQENGIVPIVEPEVLMDGDHSIEHCARVTRAVQHEVFHALFRHNVQLELMLLKPNMVVSGQSSADQTGPEEVARHTLAVLRQTVPAAVPCINFLSGGQTPEEATANLDAINRQDTQPWLLTFSYGRALQEPALAAWRGEAVNAEATMAAMRKRARLNGLASTGRWEAAMEKES